MHLWDVVEIALRWLQFGEGISYGESSLKVRARLLKRRRLADDSLVLFDVPRRSATC